MDNPLIDDPDKLVRGHAETTYIGSIQAPPGLTGEICTWRPADNPPTEGQAVVMALADGQPWTGYIADDGSWRYISGDPVTEPVTHWLNLPAMPMKEVK